MGGARLQKETHVVTHGKENKTLEIGSKHSDPIAPCLVWFMISMNPFKPLKLVGQIKGIEAQLVLA